MSNLILSVLGVIFQNDRRELLLIQRKDVPVWVFPGGGKEENESLEEAIIREIQEETHLKVKVVRLIATYTSGRFIKPVNVYECEIIDHSPALSNEVKGVQFFPLEALPAAIPPPFDEFIEDALKNGPPIIRAITSITIPKIIRNGLSHPILFIRFLLSRIGLHINT